MGKYEELNKKTHNTDIQWLFALWDPDSTDFPYENHIPAALGARHRKQETSEGNPIQQNTKQKNYAIRCKEPQERPSGLLIEQVTRLSNRREERKASPRKEWQRPDKCSPSTTVGSLITMGHEYNHKMDSAPLGEENTMSQDYKQAKLPRSQSFRPEKFRTTAKENNQSFLSHFLFSAIHGYVLLIFPPWDL